MINKQLLIIFAMMMVFTVNASAECATIGIGDGSGYVTIPITVSGAADVGSCDVNLTYDSSIVTVTSIGDGDMDNTFTNIEHADEGWVRVGAYQANTPGIVGDFILANVTFSSVATSGTCPLTITVVTFKDATPAGKPMCYNVSNGTYTATEDGGNNGNGGTYPPEPTPTNGGNVTPTVTPVITPTTAPTASPTKILPHDDPVIIEGIAQVGVIIAAAITALLLVLYRIMKTRKD